MNILQTLVRRISIKQSDFQPKCGGGEGGVYATRIGTYPQILFLTAKFAPEVGGVCAVAEALASNLSQHIAVAAPKVQPIRDWISHDRRFPFPVHRVGALEPELPRSLPPRLRGALQFAYQALWTRPLALLALARILRLHPAQILCINSLSCYWAANLRRLFPALKVVFYLHGEEVNDGPDRRRMDHIAQKTLRTGDAVVTVSSFTRTRALNCGVSPERLTIIHNGVDTDRFSPGPKDPSIEQRFRLHGKRVLLCLARFDERKGQDKLIEAMPAILAAVPETILLLVGGGDYEPHLRSLTASLALEQSVIFAGVAPDEQLAAFYRTADVYAMPNRTTDSGDTEGFGLVFLEAGACGKPVIGGRAGGVPDAILEGQTGLLVDGQSVPEIAEACIRLLANPTLAATLGQAGFLHSQANTWAAQSQKLLALCESLVSRDPA